MGWFILCGSSSHFSTHFFLFAEIEVGTPWTYTYSILDRYCMHYHFGFLFGQFSFLQTCGHSWTSHNLWGLRDFFSLLTLLLFSDYDYDSTLSLNSLPSSSSSSSSSSPSSYSSESVVYYASSRSSSTIFLTTIILFHYARCYFVRWTGRI